MARLVCGGVRTLGAEKVPRDPHRGVLTCGAGFTRDSYSHPSPSRRGLLIAHPGQVATGFSQQLYAIISCTRSHAGGGASYPRLSARLPIGSHWTLCVMQPCIAACWILPGRTLSSSHHAGTLLGASLHDPPRKTRKLRSCEPEPVAEHRSPPSIFIMAHRALRRSCLVPVCLSPPGRCRHG